MLLLSTLKLKDKVCLRHKLNNKLYSGYFVVGLNPLMLENRKIDYLTETTTTAFPYEAIAKGFDLELDSSEGYDDIVL